MRLFSVALVGGFDSVDVTNCVVAYLGLGTLARNLLAGRPAAAYGVTRAAGAAMIVLGALLVLERALA